MQISVNYIVVKKVEEPKAEGFKTVEVQDSFVYKGQVVKLPECPIFVDNHRLDLDDIVLFHKYSPDCVEIELPEGKRKFIKTSDLLAVL